MDRPAFLNSPGAVNPTGGDTTQGPHSDPNFVQGAAPGGPWPISGAPVPISQSGLPFTTNGTSYSPANPPLPGPNDGHGKV
jgi:hypothetical protein